MDMVQAGLAADVALRRNAKERTGRHGERDFYVELDRAIVASRRLLVGLAVGIVSASVLLSVIVASAAPQGVLVAGIVQ